jgi:hypothetical protein
MRKLNSQTSININGKKYDSSEEVPAEFQKFFTDADSNGVPDLVDRAIADAEPIDSATNEPASAKLAHPSSKKVAVSIHSNFTINGKNYTSLQDVPEFAQLQKTFKTVFPFLNHSEKIELNPVEINSKIEGSSEAEKNSRDEDEKGSTNATAISSDAAASTAAHYKKNKEERTPVTTQLFILIALIVLLGLYFFSR